MSGRGHHETLVLVYWSTEHEDFINVPVYTNIENAEESALSLLRMKGDTQILKNIFKVNYKGEVTKFKDLELENPNLIAKIKELTGR
jgi:hypothetical protein